MFAFVLLDNCPNGTTINFTDEEYLTSAFATTSEGLVTWTNNTGSIIPKGTVIRCQVTHGSAWNSAAAPTTSLGGVTVEAGSGTSNFVLNTNDQLYAFLGSKATPTFITAFGNLGCTGGSAGCIPSTLASGTTARNISTSANAIYYTGSTTCNGTAAACAAMINNTGTFGTATSTSSYPSNFTGSALPIELTRFEGKNQVVYNLLTWQTASETNNKGFDIERSSDGRNFTNIGFVAGKGTTNKTQAYRFEDNTSNSDIAYYRLKQLDLDGQFEYSKVVSVSQHDNNVVSVFPNPSKGVFNIVNVADVEKEQFVVINNIGQSIPITVSSNGQVDMSYFPSGIYYLRMATSGQVAKLVKE